MNLYEKITVYNELDEKIVLNNIYHNESIWTDKEIIFRNVFYIDCNSENIDVYIFTVNNLEFTNNKNLYLLTNKTIETVNSKDDSFEKYTDLDDIFLVTFLLKNYILNLSMIKIIIDNFSNNRRILNLCIENNIQAYYFLPEHLKDNKKIIKTIVSNNGIFLKDLSNHFKDDTEIVTAAVSNDGSVYQYISNRLKHNFNIIILAIKTDHTMYKYIPLKFKSKESIAIYYSVNSNISESINI